MDVLKNKCLIVRRWTELKSEKTGDNVQGALLFKTEGIKALTQNKKQVQERITAQLIYRMMK